MRAVTRDVEPHRPDRTARVLFVSGLALVVAANLRSFAPAAFTVAWDARDETWYILRWYGSALRAGHFGDFFPAIGSGYPVNANIVSGGYNPLYLLAAALFPTSALSINLLYLAYALLAFSLGYAVGRRLRLGSAAAWLLGLSTTASGYFAGHASHFSYLSTGVAALGLFLAVRLACDGHTGQAFAVAAASTFHVCTSGSPEGMVFTAMTLLVVGGIELLRSERRLPLLLGCAAGFAVGLLLALPALLHFAHQLPRTSRAAGLSVAESLSGSLPPASLLNLLNPAWRLDGIQASVDPTMDRFHLLFLSPALLLGGCWLRGSRRSLFWISCALAGLFTLLALGHNAPVPLRQWLAELWLPFRVGRFPSGQHRGFALFCLALASAVVLDGLWTRWRSRSARAILIAIVAIDFAAVMEANAWLRFEPLDRTVYYGRLRRFKVEYRGEESRYLDRPRSCPPGRLLGPVDQLRAPPTGFNWSGYANMISARYRAERRTMRWALCGPSRLWRLRSQQPHPYELVYYGPERIRLVTNVPESAQDRLLVWAEVDDGLWELAVDGQRVPIVPLAADLRGIDLSRLPGARPCVRVDMVYRGPLSRLWRRLDQPPRLEQGETAPAVLPFQRAGGCNSEGAVEARQLERMAVRVDPARRVQEEQHPAAPGKPSPRR